MRERREALLFPGQGSQTAEMREAAEAHRPELVELAIAEVGADPFELADEGTAYAQPAILCASLAAWTRAGEPHAWAFAGHSLGELSALAAAGVLDAEDAVRLAVARGRLMQEAAGEVPGGMLALLGDGAEAREVAEATEVTLANDNGPTQIVVAGSGEALAAAEAEAKAHGIRTIRLAVRGAFHTPAMERVVEPFRAELERTSFRAPATTVFSSIAARPFDDDPQLIRDDLAAALTNPVRWRETVDELYDAGVRSFAETGPGKALTRMIKRSFDDVEVRLLAEAEVAHA